MNNVDILVDPLNMDIAIRAWHHKKNGKICMKMWDSWWGLFYGTFVALNRSDVVIENKNAYVWQNQIYLTSNSGPTFP
jgi:hypothetical protein